MTSTIIISIQDHHHIDINQGQLVSYKLISPHPQLLTYITSYRFHLTLTLKHPLGGLSE